jgi:serine/threonine-protein kinase
VADAVRLGALRRLPATIATSMIQPRALINGRYRVGRRLGEGGMAVVFVGHDLLLGRDVAIKTLHPRYAADRAVRARFEREGRAAAALSHPNVIDVFDVGEDDGAPYIVMELVHGQSLKEIIAADAPFHPDDVAELLGQVAIALDYAHARGFVHRDVKPGNILVDAHGRARVVDFGIAKSLADADLTAAGDGLGTIGYLSPEQAEGLMATPASDVYAMGVVAFEMLTGELPFAAETAVGLAMRHVHDPPPAPSHLRRGLPPLLDAIVLRALDKDPTRRWPSASAFTRALRDWREHGGEHAAPGERASVEQTSGSPLLTIIIALLVVGAVAALLWTGFRGLSSSSGLPAPTAPAPLAPIITGAVEDDPSAGGETIPIIEPAQSDAPSSASAPAPTIAPAADTTIAAPNLLGQSIGGATRATFSLGLRIALDQPVFSADVPLNAVAAQDPPPGAALLAGETIRVSLSRGPSPFPASSQP